MIKNSFIMKNAWEDWAPYRNSLTEILLCVRPESVMIVGGGRCNDIDIKRLLMTASKVTILDSDSEAMTEAVAALPEVMQKKTECRTASLTGIEEEHISAFCEGMMKHARTAVENKSAEYFTGKLRAYLDDIEGRLIKSESDLKTVLPEGSVDVVICSGVHSQLFSTMMYFIKMLFGSVREYLPGLDEFEAEVDDRIRHMNDIVIPVINRAVVGAAKRVAVFGNEYMPDDPVEGAHQCIRDIEKNYEPREVHLKWDFNKAAGKSYDMLLQVCKM